MLSALYRAPVAAERARFDAVLFDWCGTLVEYPTHADRFRPILQRLGRPHDPDTLKRLVHDYEAAAAEPAARKADERCDLSAADHAATKHVICELAGIDSELATEIERSYGDVATYPTYPEVVDVITSLTDAGVKVAIISDFHVDLRPHLAGLARPSRPDCRLCPVVRSRSHEARPVDVRGSPDLRPRTPRALSDGRRQPAP